MPVKRHFIAWVHFIYIIKLNGKVKSAARTAFIGAVPLTPYGTPSTTEVPDAIEPYLNDHDVMLLENHGALTVGSDVITAYYRMESLELWAKITINAIILGGSYDIDRKNIDKLINLRSYYKITGKHPGYRKFERREKGEPTDK